MRKNQDSVTAQMATPVQQGQLVRPTSTGKWATIVEVEVAAAIALETRTAAQIALGNDHILVRPCTGGGVVPVFFSSAVSAGAAVAHDGAGSFEAQVGSAAVLGYALEGAATNGIAPVQLVNGLLNGAISNSWAGYKANPFSMGECASGAGGCEQPFTVPENGTIRVPASYVVTGMPPGPLIGGPFFESGLELWVNGSFFKDFVLVFSAPSTFTLVLSGVTQFVFGSVMLDFVYNVPIAASANQLVVMNETDVGPEAAVFNFTVTAP